MIGELSEPLSLLSEFNSVIRSRRRKKKIIFNLIFWKSNATNKLNIAHSLFYLFFYDIWISYIQKSSYF